MGYSADIVKDPLIRHSSFITNHQLIRGLRINRSILCLRLGIYMFWCKYICFISTVYFFDNLVFILTKSHLGSYPCPLNINFYWNMGFTLGIVIVVQIVTGLFISFHYSSDINEAYYSVFFLIREIYYGWSLRFLHSSGASFVFLFVFLHIGRSLFYGSFFYNPNTWFSGILIFIVNGNCIFRLCLTIWTNEFLGSNCNYKFIISFSMFNRMDLWRILC